MQALLRQLQIHPIIPSVRSPEAVCRAAETPAAAIFLLGGSILTLPESVQIAHENGKRAFIHLDLTDGFGHDERLWSVQL